MLDRPSVSRLRAIAEAAGYFPWLHIIEPTGRRLTGRHPRAAYWRDYSRRRYWTDPAYRARKRAAAARSLARRRLIEQPQEAPARSEPGAPPPGVTQPPAGERRTVRSRDLPTSATTPPAVSLP